MNTPDHLEKYYKRIVRFSPSVEKEIDDLDRKFYLLYLNLCVMIAPFFGYCLGSQEWFKHFISNFF